MATIDAAAKESRANAQEDLVTITSGAKEIVDRTLASAMGLADKIAHPMDKQARNQVEERTQLRKADVSAQQAAIRQMARQRAESERLAARLEVADTLTQGQGAHRYPHPLSPPPDAVAPAPFPAPSSVGDGGISAPSSNLASPPPPRPTDSAISEAPPHPSGGDSAISPPPPQSGGEDSAISAAPPHFSGSDSSISAAPPHSGGGASAVLAAPPHPCCETSAISATPLHLSGRDSAISADAEPDNPESVPTNSRAT